MYHLKKVLQSAYTGPVDSVQIACASPRAKGVALEILDFIAVSGSRQCSKCAGIAKKKMISMKKTKLVSRFSKDSGILYDTLNYDRAVRSLKHTYSDIEFVENELLAGRKVMTGRMWYEIIKD